MNTPTPTPRTDAATYPADCLGTTLVTNRDCSRALERDLTALTAEREQLRADAERLRSDRDCEKRIRKDAEELREDAIARAEKSERAETVALANWNDALERAMKAEADLVALAQCHDDNCRGVVKIADDLAAEREKAERYRLASLKLEAELAVERARMDDLVADLNDACITLASAKDDCDDYALLNTGFKLTAVRDVLLQYIPNAAMKEGAK